MTRLNSAGVRINRSDEATKRAREDRHHIIPAADFQRDRRPFHHCEGRRRASGLRDPWALVNCHRDRKVHNSRTLTAPHN